MARSSIYRGAALLTRFTLTLALAAGVGVGRAPAQLAVAADKKIPKKFSPEIEAQFGELLKKLHEEKAKDEEGRMKSELEKVVQATGLDEAHRKALEAPVKAAVEAATNQWVEQAEKMFRTTWSAQVELQTFQLWIAQAPSIVRSGYGIEYTKSSDLPVWKEALAKSFDDKQAAAWKTAADEREKKFEEQIKEYVNATQGRVRDQALQSISAIASNLSSSLGLDEDRAKKLKKLGEEAADKTADTIKEKARKLLRSSDDGERMQLIGMNGIYIAPDPADSPEKQTIWKEGVEKILTADEVTRWKANLARRQERRSQVYARTLVWGMDQAVALTTKQREQLEPLAATLVHEQVDAFFDTNINSYSSLSLQNLYQAASQAKEEDLGKILDAKQIEHWKTASGQKARRTRVINRGVRQQQADSASKPEPFEPEDLENAFSDYLYKMTDKEQDRSLTDALLQVEDAVRVASLEGKAAQRLATAARGAVEQYIDSWKDGTASSIRSQFPEPTPAAIRMFAENQGDDSGRRMRLGQMEDGKKLWEAALKSELSADQHAAWQKEIDARKAYEDRMITSSLVAEFDRLCPLTDDQAGTLESKLTSIVRDYSPDIGQMFSSRDGWFLQGYYMLTPIAGIPEDDMKKLLNADQWKQWSSTNQYGNAAQYWRMVESNHKQRVKAKVNP